MYWQELEVWLCWKLSVCYLTINVFFNYRQQKIAEREKRAAEQQRKKMEKEAQRLMKKEQNKIGVKLS